MTVIAFRLNANAQIGSGHLQRCLTLASGLRSVEPECQILFLTSRSEEFTPKIATAGHAQIDIGAIDNTDEDLEAAGKVIAEHRIDILIIDMYAIDPGYLAALKKQVKILALIDDFMHIQKYPVHMLINPNIYAHMPEYKHDEDTELLLGTEFAQLREEFDAYQEFRRETTKNARHILVTFGGSDYKGASILTVKALKRLGERRNGGERSGGDANMSQFIATIIVGKAFRKGEELAGEIGLDPRFIVLEDITDISKKMANADLVIASPSTTFYELLFFKLPVILITQAENQRMLADYAGKNGLAVSMGQIDKVSEAEFADVIQRLVEDYEERARMSARMDELVDGFGRFRVAEEILRAFNERQ